MRRAALLLLASASATLGALDPQCFDEYQCIFHRWVSNGNEYSWDLRPLCRGAGNEYTYTVPGGAYPIYTFNICGTISKPCAPQGWVPYISHGVATQFLDTDPAGNPCPKCPDADTGLQVCCTGNCVVLAHDIPRYDLVDPNNVNAGITISHAGMPPSENDNFLCPTDPTTNLPIERQLTIVLQCDKSVSDVVIDVANETSTCHYQLTGRSKAACASKGDPFDPYRDDPAHSFGFVVLGSVLTIFTYYLVTFGETKGWWDPVKRYLPAIPGLSGSRGGALYGGSSYKSVSASSGATPISAGAYGATGSA